MRSIDDLALFEEFKESLLPKLQRWVLEGRSVEFMRREVASYVQAQAISKALRGDFRAIKDTLDRYEGTAVQRVESKSVYTQMSKKELAALALQKLLDAKIIDASGRVIRDIDSMPLPSPETDTDDE